MLDGHHDYTVDCRDARTHPKLPPRPWAAGFRVRGRSGCVFPAAGSGTGTIRVAGLRPRVDALLVLAPTRIVARSTARACSGHAIPPAVANRIVRLLLRATVPASRSGQDRSTWVPCAHLEC